VHFDFISRTKGRDVFTLILVVNDVCDLHDCVLSNCDVCG
jgi:hypothetical protein